MTSPATRSMPSWPRFWTRKAMVMVGKRHDDRTAIAGGPVARREAQAAGATAPGEVRAIRRGLPALARPARAVVPPPDGPAELGVQRLLSVADPVAARPGGVPPGRAEAGRSPPQPADDVRGARRRSAPARPREASPAARSDRCVVVERGGTAPAAGGGGPPPV